MMQAAGTGQPREERAVDRQHHVVVVDDEPASRALLAGYLAADGHKVTQLETGRELRRLLGQSDIHLILLDLRLPGEDGIALLRELRDSRDPIGVMMVTAHREDDVERVVALELGADDWLTKPFNPRELLARARNILRRCDASSRVPPPPRRVRFAGWTLELDSWRLTGPDGEPVRLTRGEYEVLAALVTQPNRVLTRDNLLDGTTHRQEAPTDRTIDALVGRLRRKIEADPHAPRLIETVHGVGYVFRPPGHTG
jgi:two-component system torCAD operon response regulator TorR